jgi:hypothetical protein
MGFFGVVRNSSQVKERLILSLARGEKRSIECRSLMGDGMTDRLAKRQTIEKPMPLGGDLGTTASKI